MTSHRLALAVLALSALGLLPGTAAGQAPDSVRFHGNPQSSIWAGVALPAGAVFWTSGTVPPVANPDAERGSPERFGDTRTQARGVLTRLDELLREAGLGLSDLVYLRVYVAPDPRKDGEFDFAGWNQAYAEFFGTAANPNKVARSTVGVAALVSPDYLIEIEAFAAYPP